MSYASMRRCNSADLGLKALLEIVRAPAAATAPAPAPTPAPALAPMVAITPALAPKSAPADTRSTKLCLSPFYLVKFVEFWLMKMMIVRLNLQQEEERSNME
jgi:hypothetical protein